MVFGKRFKMWDIVILILFVLFIVDIIVLTIITNEITKRTLKKIEDEKRGMKNENRL